MLRFCRKPLLQLLFGAGLFFAACSDGEAETAALTIGGTGAALATVAIIGDAFAAQQPGIAVKVLPSLGSNGGIRALRAGSIDLSLSTRPLTQDERNTGLEAIEYGTTALVFAGNVKSGPTDLTDAQVVAKYAAGNPQWPDGVRARVVLRPEAETDTALLRRTIPGLSAALESARTTPGMPTAYNDQENADLLARIPGSFGCLALSQLLSEARPLTVFSLNGVAATLASIRDGSYPMTKTFYAVYALDRPQPARAFIGFLQSQEGQGLLARNGTIAR